ncbi:MAG TPA: cation diffusion facilitator family transporter [Gaiellales bacterium]|jgi:cation diffusion facilitator family transporter
MAQATESRAHGGRVARGGQEGESRLTILVALASNALIAVAKLLAGLASGSAAMLAEAAHSIADTVDQLVLLASLRLGRRPADEEHQFGHGKERFFWAFVAAVWIFFAGALFSIVQGVVALRGGHSIGDPLVSLVVLGVAFVAEGASLIRAARQLQQGAVRSRMSFTRFVGEVRDPAPRVVLLEDAAAVAGVVVAALGLAASAVTGSEVFDALASIAVGVILAVAAVGVGTHAKALLLGESARAETREFLEREIENRPEVVSVPELRTMHVGPDDVLVAGRVEFRDELSVPQIEELTDRIIDDLRERDPAIRHVFLQPATSERG